jgi:hypothetical protein
VKLVARTGWGGPSVVNVPKLPVRKGMAVHYNGPATSLHTRPHASCFNYWLGTHNYHKNTNGWSAIGYAWGVCPHGYIFEGRGFDCDQAAQGDPGNQTHQSVQFMLGGSERPTDLMLQAWYDLRANLMKRGVGKDIKPHSAFLPTSCPGDYLRSLINNGVLFKGGAPEPEPDEPPTPPPPKEDKMGKFSEPNHNYKRVSYDGRTINIRTRELLEDARRHLDLDPDGRFDLSQGSYSSSVSASAGTHSGGGVVDIASSSWSVAKGLRQAGFAAWVRSPSEGPWGWHIHAVALGDREAHSSAKNQMQAYFDGRNGLANNAGDSAPSWVGRPFPSWAAKYRN